MTAILIAKTLVIFLLLMIFYSLFSAVKALIFNKSSGKNLLVALTWRIGLSLLAFVVLLIGYYKGFWYPHKITL